ncbi:hypothetical protein [Halopiger goleimassiliensis]|uniref:hypothetical protein n=1 Tax=Halopiger goleimassiliensis TaxID=1293048 RepID=UPI000A554B2A|nr:hypothetical protein [Halopiger goleimassiliensis]
MVELSLLFELVRDASIGVVGAGLLAAITSLLTATAYRWTTTRAPPSGMPTFVGLSIVAVYLTASVLSAGAFFATTPLDHQFSAGYLLATFLLGGVVAAASGRLGDRIACQLLDLSRIDASGDAAAAVRSARLAVDVDLPETIETAEGYRPVEPSVRRAIEGTTVRLPHDLSADDRRGRIERHLEREYDLGYAEVRTTEDGSVDRLLVGRQSSGLGPMLPPRTVAVAIQADSAPDASLGDPIEIWSTGEGSRLLATGTVRSVDGSVATVIVDRDLADDLADDERYRLVTRPDDPTDAYEFASTIREVDETVTTLTVAADGPLDGEFAGWLPGRVLVIDRDDELLAMPDDKETIRAGDDLWVLAAPDALTDFDPTAGDASTIPSKPDETESDEADADETDAEELTV